MLTPGYKNSFKKDLKLIKKRGKDVKKLYDVISDLINQNPLAKKHVDHPLKGRRFKNEVQQRPFSHLNSHS